MNAAVPLPDLRIKIFADGADASAIRALRQHPLVRGFTTNPTLMRKAGIADYETFAREMIAGAAGLPVSFEVIADDFEEMRRQACKIGRWGANVYVKIPVTDTRGASTAEVIRDLCRAGIQLNITAIFTGDQLARALEALSVAATPACFSIFAGRIADTGRDPVPLVATAVEQVRARPAAEVIWASARETLNVFQAEAAGCHIITLTPDLLAKLHLAGKDLAEFSRETVHMFYEDARHCGLEI